MKKKEEVLKTFKALFSINKTIKTDEDFEDEDIEQFENLDEYSDVDGSKSNYPKYKSPEGGEA